MTLNRPENTMKGQGEVTNEGEGMDLEKFDRCFIAVFFRCVSKLEGYLQLRQVNVGRRRIWEESKVLRSKGNQGGEEIQLRTLRQYN